MYSLAPSASTTSSEYVFWLADALLATCDAPAQWLRVHRALVRRRTHTPAVKIALALCRAMILQQPMAEPFRTAYRTDNAALLATLAS